MTFIEDTHSCLNCTCKAPLFGFLSTSEFEKVDAHRYEITYNPGEVIYKQGGPATHVLSFNTGLAKIVFEENGKNIILGLIKSGTFLAGPGMHTDRRHHYSIVSITESKVCAIDHAVFIDLLSKNKTFMNDYLQEVNKAYISLLYRLAGQVNQQVKGKIASAIIYLSETIFGNLHFPFLLNTREMAELSGVSKESAARTLKEFSEDKLIQLNRKELKILDIEKLIHISEFG